MLKKAVPVPESAAVCGDDWPLSVIVSVPDRSPSWVGVKVMLNVQVALTAMADPIVQVLVCAKSPEMEMAVMVSKPGPVFLSVIVWLGEVCPIVVLPNVKLVGVNVTTPPTPVPVIGMAIVPPT